MSGPNERDEIAEALDVLIVDAAFPSRGPGAWPSASRITDAILASDWLAERDRRTAAKTLREAAEQARSIGHHWSGAPALAFFALAGDLRDRADRIERDE